MNKRIDPESLSVFSIAAVERDTGLPKDTLRVWEKRYRFPQPQRNSFDDRVYPFEQVEKLRLVKRLIDAGHRPGKIMGLSMQALLALNGVSKTESDLAIPTEHMTELQGYLQLIRQGHFEMFRQAMSCLVSTHGLQRFVMEVVAPLNVLVGKAWVQGCFGIFEEHLYTEVMQVVLRNALSTMSTTNRRPTVLLTTLPNELHGLGLLMAECILTSEGAQCFSLGIQTPIYDIVLACKTGQIDIVALSFSSAQNTPCVLDNLLELKKNLPLGVALWCGGSSPVLRHQTSDAFLYLKSLKDIAPAIQNWRRQTVGLDRQGDN